MKNEMKNILVIGATSAIAQHAARCFAEKNAALFIVGRDEQKTKAVADDLKVRGAAKIEYALADLDRTEGHAALLEKARAALGTIDAALIAHGTLSDQKACEQDFIRAEASLKNNFLNVVSLTTWLANYFEREKHGCLAVISSVAGDRGRQSNYVYGTAKGATSLFLQGLRNRLAKSGVAVVTIKPGPVDTPMTAHLKPGILSASASGVGRGVHRAMIKRRNVVYLPWFWRWIMLVIRHIPECLFKRLSL